MGNQKRLVLKFVFCALLLPVFAACQNAFHTPPDKRPESDAKAVETPGSSNAAGHGVLQKMPVDVASLANKSPAELDGIFGLPAEVKEIALPKKGEYRLYRVADAPKGLAVRFYGGRAKNFNLILSEPAATAQQALKTAFAIDVRERPPAKDANEPLSEKWSGRFGGVEFSNIYAKRERAGGRFVFVLAEAAD